jgi:hypothetical protein
MRIELHIEELVLEGVPLAGAQAEHLQAALIEALTQRLGEDGALAARLAASGGQAVVRAASIHLPARPDGRTLGRQIAASLHDGLARPTRANDAP